MEVSGQLHAPAALPPLRIATGTPWIGGWVGPRAGLDAMAKRKFLCPCRNSNPGRLARSLVTVLIEIRVSNDKLR
jgi:hypothetical protein